MPTAMTAPAPSTDTGFAYRPPAKPAAAMPGKRCVWALRAASVLAAATLVVIPEQSGNSADFDAAPAVGGPASEVQPVRPASLPATSGEPFAIAPAAPFVPSYGDAASPGRAEDCLTQAIYYEGALEPAAGQRAIAQVVLNRVRHPQYPDSVCGVVFEGQHLSTGCQFTFTCDGSRARAPVAALWRKANLVAKAALGGSVAKEVGLSTHYHADYVQPYWSSTLDYSGQIGRHIFYRWRGNAGRPEAFSMRYAGREPLIGEWRARTATRPEPAGSQPERATGAFVPVELAGEDIAGRDTAQPIAPAAVPFKARPLRLASGNDQPQ